MNNKLFTRRGWFFVPTSLLGFVVCGLAAAFLVTVFLAVDRRSHSASDTLYGLFPYAVCTFLAVDWIGRRSSEKNA